MKTIGIVLIIIGIVMVFVNQVGFTHKEKVVDLGSVEVSKDKKENIAWPLYTGVIIAVVGVGVTVAGSRQSGKNS